MSSEIEKAVREVADLIQAEAFAFPTANVHTPRIMELCLRLKLLAREIGRTPPSSATPGDTPEERFEHFVQAGIARSPEPLRELGEYLARVLDEDEFPKADRLLLQLATATPQPQERAGSDLPVKSAETYSKAIDGAGSDAGAWKQPVVCTCHTERQRELCMQRKECVVAYATGNQVKATRPQPASDASGGVAGNLDSWLDDLSNVANVRKAQIKRECYANVERALIDLSRALAESRADGERLEREFSALLPGVYYMDPPDGGSVTVLEQIQRMAKDAERYRFLRLRLFRSDVAETIFDYPADTTFAPTTYGEASEIDGLIDAAFVAAQEVGRD